MIGAVGQRNLDVDHRETGNNTGGQNRIQALFHARNEFLGYRTADNLALELIARTLFIGFDLKNNAGDLASTTGLLLVGVVDLLLAG